MQISCPVVSEQLPQQRLPDRPQSSLGGQHPQSHRSTQAQSSNNEAPPDVTRPHNAEAEAVREELGHPTREEVGHPTREEVARRQHPLEEAADEMAE